MKFSLAAIMLMLISSSLMAASKIELPWTASSESLQATLKSALYQALKADEESEYPQERIKGNYNEVTADDGKSRVVCEEQKVPGVIQIQQFRCVIETK